MLMIIDRLILITHMCVTVRFSAFTRFDSIAGPLVWFQL